MRLSIFLFFPLLACAPARLVLGPGGPPVSIEVRDDLGEVFAAERVEGAFVLLELGANRAHARVVGERLAGTRFTPASTFRIPNTLIGLETGVIDGPSFRLEWDRKKRHFEAWNRSHDLASALRHSVVWYYQEVARRVGLPRMQRFLDGFGYGNQRVGGAVDRFWLDHSLRISPFEQIAFLYKMHAGRLPVRAEHVALLWRLLVLEERPGFVLRGKTGLNDLDGRWIGWLVGKVESRGRIYLYATLVLAPRELPAGTMFPLRERLTRSLLGRLGVP